MRTKLRVALLVATGIALSSLLVITVGGNSWSSGNQVPSSSEPAVSLEAKEIAKRWASGRTRQLQVKSAEVNEAIRVFRQCYDQVWLEGSDGLLPYLGAEELTTAIRWWQAEIKKSLENAKVKDVVGAQLWVQRKYQQELTAELIM
ncbi:MAG: hypothetical protein RMI91_13860 [Gemmatales bacterium]|nr:hypothetical protein [Gemmatales bacterium]MDW7995730.1 hypothetical protein [Gemmatales bacterium]